MILEKLGVNNSRDLVTFFGIYISEDGVNVDHPLSLDDEIVTYITNKSKSRYVYYYISLISLILILLQIVKIKMMVLIN